MAEEWEDNSPEAIAAQAANEDPENIRNLREAANRGKKASERAAVLERENAFLKAGVDVSTDRGQLLLEAFKGDLTPDAIKEYETKIFGAPTTTPPEPEYKDEAAATAARQALANGGEVPSSQSTPDPYDTGKTIYKDGVAKGQGRDDALVDAFQSVFDAAASGDQRVISGRNKP